MTNLPSRGHCASAQEHTHLLGKTLIVAQSASSPVQWWHTQLRQTAVQCRQQRVPHITNATA